MKLGLAPLMLAVSGAAIVVACATDDESGGGSPAPSQVVVPVAEAGPPLDAGHDAATPGCTAKLCPVTAPMSTLVSLNAVWGSSKTDLWAVGTRGTILHGDGTTFTAVASGTDEVLFDVWGRSAADVWIVSASAPIHTKGFAGSDTVFEHVFGESWVETEAKTGRIWSVSGTAAGDVWFAGESSSRFGEYAAMWQKASGPDGGIAFLPRLPCAGAPCGGAHRALRFWSDTRAWVVGFSGGSYALEPADGGAAWITKDTRTHYALESVWGSSPDDVWAVGGNGTVRHYTNDASKKWTVVGVPTTSALHSVWGSSANDVWMCGDDGVVLHFDGNAWMPIAIGVDGVMPNLFSIWGSGPDDVWIVGEGVILHINANAKGTP